MLEDHLIGPLASVPEADVEAAILQLRQRTELLEGFLALSRQARGLHAISKPATERQSPAPKPRQRGKKKAAPVEAKTKAKPDGTPKGVVGEARERVIRFLASNGPAPIEVIGNDCGLSEEMVRRCLKGPEFSNKGVEPGEWKVTPRGIRRVLGDGAVAVAGGTEEAGLFGEEGV